MVVIGVDPGSRKTGYGIIRVESGKLIYLTSGVINAGVSLDLPNRLKIIHSGVCQVLDGFSPDEFAIENVFMAKNASSALKLGQARGAAIVAATQQDIPVYEYEARKVKQSVVGSGAADKLQVQHMIRVLLGLQASPQEDAADALAVAICHVNTQSSMKVMSPSSKFRRGRIVQ